jgi:diguanylate cyclase (GGDEF)-like protein
MWSLKSQAQRETAPNGTPGLDASAERSQIAETLLSSAARLIQARNELEIIKGVCESVCSVSSHICLAWTWFGPTTTSVIRPQVFAGAASAYAADMVIERNFITELGPAFRTLKGDTPESFEVSRWSPFGPWRGVARDHGVRNVLAVPLQSGFSNMSGIFVIYADHERYFERVGEGIFTALGALFSSVLGASAELTALKETVNRDSLTGVLNRHALPIVERRISRQSLFDPQSFVMVIDLDHFKVVNDTYGHPIGDQVLRNAAQTMQSLLRREDDVIRWGGEEFVVCLANISTEDALKVANKLRMAIEAMVEPVRITASVGLAEVMPQRPLADSISVADKALFDAKQGGRNRVCFRE